MEVLDDQLNVIYNSSLRTPDVVEKTCQKRWMIDTNGEKERVREVRACCMSWWYIYIYIYWQIFFVDTNFIKHNRHFMPIYFLLDPFEFPYYFYRIRGELIYVLSIVVCIHCTFCPILGHHQGRIYYKSYVTFVLAYYNDVRASLSLNIMAFTFKWNSIISVSS